MAPAPPWTKPARQASGRPYELKISRVAGTTSATNITVTGIRKHDQIIAVLDFQDTAGATAGLMADRASETTVTANDTIQLSTTNTTGHGLAVFWLKRH